MSEPVHTSETPATDASETPAPAPEQPAPETPAEEVIPGAEHLGDPGKQALDRMKNERDALKARLREIEDRDLSELQKAQRDREELAAKYAELEQNSLRSRVALAKNLDAEGASFLTGSTEEELLAAADRLIAYRGNVPPTTPRPDPGQGPRPTTPEAEAAADYLRFFPDEAPKAR